MKNFIFLVLFVFTLGQVNSQVIFQNDFENWTDSHTPVGMKGAKTSLETDSINQYSVSAHGGTYAVQLVNKESTHKRFTTQPLQVNAGTTYTISFWVRGHGNIRTGLFDGRTANSGYAPYNTYITVNSNQWAQYSQTVTCENTNAAGEFIFSVQLTNEDIDHLQLDDIEISVVNPNAPSISITAPANNSLVMSSNVNIEFTVSNFVLGTDGKVKYTVNGGAAQFVTASPIALTSLADGTYSVVLELVDMNDQSLNPAVSASVNFTVSTALPAYVSIYDIQYTTDPSGDSPYADDTVQTSGIVTGVYSQGFFLQNGSGAWNGIYVFSANYAPQVVVGDSIIIVGKVKEYYGLTELTNLSYLQVHSQGNTLPEPAIVTATQVKSEPYEGVLVKLMNATCVNPNAGYGMWTVNDGQDTCKIHNLLYDYTPTLNHVYHITGPVYYAFNEYRIEPRSASDVVDVTGIDAISLENVAVFPNPAKDFISVNGNKQIRCVELMDAQGKLIIKQTEVNSANLSIDIRTLTKGNYYLYITYSDESKGVAKVIK